MVLPLGLEKEDFTHFPSAHLQMNEEHKNALERSLHDICQDLDADEILPYLRSKEVIQRSQVQEIMKITSKLRQNMQLIDFITEADPSAFQEFINALHTCNKGHLAEKILARLPSSSNQQLTQSEMNITDTFNNQQNEGRMVGGPVSGGKVILGDIHNIAQMVVQGDYHAYSQDTGQAPSTSLPVSSQPTAEDWQQKLEM
uniref:CARD domain-containing protein n=1 Tax=Plectus sambesii TaxID=2011161 RepID=A0A914WVP1_9BILA